MTYTKPLPNIDADIAPFWAAVRRHEFRLLRCGTCGAWYWPASYCRACEGSGAFRENMTWEQASGRGRVFAFNVHHWAFDPAFKEDVPYVYALIELAEGPMFGTNIVDRDAQDIRVGDAVEVIFRDIPGAEVTLPLARVVG